MSSIPAATIDPSRRLDLYARFKRVGSKKFIFLDSTGNPVNITSFGFQFKVYSFAGAYTPKLNFAVGTGLTISGSGNNELTVSFTAANLNIKEGEYFYELYKSSTEKTYINGKFILNIGVFDGVDSETTILTIDDSGVVEITISDGGSSSGNPTWGSIDGTFSDQTDAYSLVTGRMVNLTIMAINGGATINNMPLAETELFGAVNVANRAAFDATYFTQVRLTARISAASLSVNTPRMYAQWSTNDTVWTTLGTGTGTEAVLMSTTGTKRTDFITLPAGAKADVIWRIVTIGGDGAADPTLGSIHLQFK